MPKSGSQRWMLVLAAVVGAGLIALGWHFFAQPAPVEPGAQLLAALDPADAQLQPALTALRESKGAAGARGLLKIFQDRIAHFQPGFLFPLPAWNDETRHEAEAALAGTFTLQGVTGTIPSRADGGWDWAWGGPNHDPEFAWFLNRQHQIPALFVAWRETGDVRYHTALNAELRDWLRQNPRPRHYSFSSSWRALEVARRLEEAWMPVLFAAQAGDALDPDVLLGMLADIPDHAMALRDTHSFSGNHLVTEMTGLAAVALAFPEFKDARSWFDYALTGARAEAAREFYPDGAETELSNLYQRVVMLELQRLADLLAAAGRQTDLAEIHATLEKAWNYFAHTLDPRGHGPLNNDSSLDDDAALVRKMAGVYHRPDWLFIATQGREGTAPAGSPTEFFPDAGLALMRSGWDASAQWAFFNAGPRGSEHQHDDRLQLSVGGGGREFLVDDGRYNYQPGPWRDYFTGPQGHNVILLDGRGPMRAPNLATQPGNGRHEITTNTDFFSATAPFAGDALAGQGPAYHTREVLYSSNICWLVVDRINCAGPHTLEALWHFHPDCSVRRDGNLLYTADVGKANLGLLAFEAPHGGWEVELVRGRETPSPQGWYSPAFNERVPATCASFKTSVDGPCTVMWFIWIAPPGKDVAAMIPAMVPALKQLRVLGLGKL